MVTILRKELADYFTSVRFFVLLGLVILASAAALYEAQNGIRSAGLPSGFVFLGLYITGGVFPFLISLLIPIVGIAFGFDAINSERSSGTLSRVMAQPIYRDNLINGKFLAGLITMAIMIASTLLIVGGYGLRIIGVTPTSEEVFRLFIYFLYAVIFGGFWMAMATLFSVVFRRIATSLLTSIGIWLFFFILISLIAPAIANNIVPVSQNSTPDVQLHNLMVEQNILRFSPNTLFSEATQTLLSPRLGDNILSISLNPASQYMLPNPLSLSQSLLLVWPQLTSLIALTAIVFAICYILFMRQEIRAT